MLFRSYIVLNDFVETGYLSDNVQLAIGFNEITFVSEKTTTTASLRVGNTANADFETSEIIVIREYSEKYLTINFSNTCDIGDLVYQNGFEQTTWLETEAMEMSFPQEEEGQKNGEGGFVRTFARQVKKYLARTKALPAYMIEVFNRMKLHDTIEIIDQVGDINTAYNLEVDHEWLWDDKYYARADLGFDYDETFVVGGCCNNLT